MLMDRGFFGTMAAGALALACCAGGPAVFAAIGGLSLSAVLGSGAGLLASLALAVAVIARRRAGPGRTCEIDASRGRADEKA